MNLKDASVYISMSLFLCCYVSEMQTLTYTDFTTEIYLTSPVLLQKYLMASIPAPIPTPDPTPNPLPDPLPDPTPTPDPLPEPFPRPDPSPDPDPQPTPVPPSPIPEIT